jgi:hypothetical protein
MTVWRMILGSMFDGDLYICCWFDLYFWIGNISFLLGKLACHWPSPSDATPPLNFMANNKTCYFL